MSTEMPLVDSILVNAYENNNLTTLRYILKDLPNSDTFELDYCKTVLIDRYTQAKSRLSNNNDTLNNNTKDTTMNTMTFGTPLSLNGVVMPHVLSFPTAESAKSFVETYATSCKYVFSNDLHLVVLLGEQSAKDFIVDMYKVFGKTKKDFFVVLWAALVAGCKESIATLVEWFKSVPSLVKKGIESLKGLFARLKDGDKKSWINTLLVVLLSVAMVVTAVVAPGVVIAGGGAALIAWYLIDKYSTMAMLADWVSSKIDLLVEKLDNKKAPVAA